MWYHILFWIAANGQYSSAMKFYMEAGVVASDFFSSAVPKSIYDDQVCRKTSIQWITPTIDKC